jgi:hypothetical protein
VLGYDQDKQLALLKKLINKDIAWEDIGLILVVAMIVLMLFVSYLLLRNNGVLLNPTNKIYQQFLKKLSKVGVTKLRSEGAIDFGNRAAKTLPNQAIEILEISALYSSMQYAKHQASNNIATSTNKQTLNLLKQLVKNLKIK